MKSRFSLLLLFLFPIACSTPETENPVVNLVPAEALATVFPSVIDSFTYVRDTTYLGYREAERDTFALITIARTYSTPSGILLAVNLSSFDDRNKFLNTYGFLSRDMSEEEWETYDIMLGRMVVVDEHHAAEAKSFDSLAVRAAMDLIDYEHLASLTAEPIEVDSTFLVRTD